MTRLGIVMFAALALGIMTAAPDISGDWGVEAEFDDSSLAGGGFDCAFKQDGERLTGTCSEATVTGEVKGQDVSWQMKAGGNPVTTSFRGTTNESRTFMSGRFTTTGAGGRFSASRG